MNRRYAVIWKLDGRLRAGSLDVVDDRLVLRGRGRTASIPLARVAHSTIERRPAMRLKGLPVLTMVLVDGGVLRVASLERAGALYELAALVSSPPALSAAR